LLSGARSRSVPHFAEVAVTHHWVQLETIDQLANAIWEAADRHDAATNAWLLRPLEGTEMAPVLWVTVHPQATAGDLASLSADLRVVQRRLSGPMTLPVMLLVDGGDRQLRPLGMNDPLGRLQDNASEA
jgi:hypothetical protein